MSKPQQVGSWWNRLLPATRKDIDRIMTKLDELQGIIDKIDDQLTKATTEITNAINDLKNQLANVDIPPGAQASLDKLTALAQGLDDIVPDGS